MIGYHLPAALRSSDDAMQCASGRIRMVRCVHACMHVVLKSAPTQAGPSCLPACTHAFAPPFPAHVWGCLRAGPAALPGPPAGRPRHASPAPGRPWPPPAEVKKQTQGDYLPTCWWCGAGACMWGGRMHVGRAHACGAGAERGWGSWGGGHGAQRLLQRICTGCMYSVVV